MSKILTVNSATSTESEFMQTVLAAKGVKFIRHVMNEIEQFQTGPSPMNEDNAACIMMINQSRPTNRTRHIDIVWFAIQQWKANGDLIMNYIDTSKNSADALTKALGWVLHNKHAARAMGHYGSPYSFDEFNMGRFHQLEDIT